jgi:hypothetical protein
MDTHDDGVGLLVAAITYVVTDQLESGSDLVISFHVRRRRFLGWLVLITASVIGSVAWLTAWSTYEPGLGFESMTVPAAMVGAGSVAGIAVAAVLLDQPIALSLFCVLAATAVGIEIYQLAQDIPGAASTGVAAYEELYRSRVLALWLLTSATVLLFLVGAMGLLRRHRHLPRPNEASA